MYNELIKLISEIYTFDDYGNQVSEEVVVERLAKVKSIGQNEFYSAATADFKPEIKFVMADYLDYSGQKKIKYTAYSEDEVEYTVLRNYRNDKNEIELTCGGKRANV